MNITYITNIIYITLTFKKTFLLNLCVYVIHQLTDKQATDEGSESFLERIRTPIGGERLKGDTMDCSERATGGSSIMRPLRFIIIIMQLSMYMLHNNTSVWDNKKSIQKKLILN